MSDQKKYKYLLFDADNTLFDFDKASEVSFAQTLLHFEIAENPHYFKNYLKINKACWEQLERGEIGPKEIKTIRFKLFCEHIGVERDGLAMNDYYLNALAHSSQLIEGARDLLDTLKSQGYSLSIITNGLAAVQRPRLAQAQLTDYFDAITVSEEIGIAKPNPDFFLDTFAQLNQPPKAEALIIGDNLKSDILGGQKAGIDTVWYNPRRAKGSNAIQPTFEIRRLNDILELL